MYFKSSLGMKQERDGIAPWQIKNRGMSKIMKDIIHALSLFLPPSLSNTFSLGPWQSQGLISLLIV